MLALDKVVVLDFGAQYSQLIGRRVRELGVYSEILPYTTPLETLRDPRVKAVILSGGPSSVFEKNAPRIGPGLFSLGKPVLGICYGMQLMAQLCGGRVVSSKVREFGHAKLSVREPGRLFRDLPADQKVWMSHGDVVETLPPGFTTTGLSGNGLTAAMADESRNFYAVQFHPEVTHTEHGNAILSNFIFGVAACVKNWDMKRFMEEKGREIQLQVGERPVVMAVSGGVDSTVMAVFLSRVLKGRLHCVFVDNGVLRLREAAQVVKSLAGLGVHVDAVDAADLFLRGLRNVADPEKKRKIIGRLFIQVFFRKIRRVEFLAQGTLYPDVIESVSVKGPSSTIKTHHNRVKGILDLMRQGRVVEPFCELFKDEVRRIGTELGLPDSIVWRQPFPGPGLAVRMLGSVTPEKLRVLREADAILQEELGRDAVLYRSIWQSFCVLLPVRSVGVMGDMRTYQNAVVLRCVTSQDGMTADWVEFPAETLRRASSRIVNEVKGVNRVVYDITSKPPATIEWE